MKIFFLFLLAVMSQALPHNSDWQQFKVQHRKKYSSHGEEQKRMDIFLRHKRYIEEHNKKYQRGLVSYSLRMNHLGDLSHEEYLGLLRPAVSTPKILKSESFLRSLEKVPEEIDWRTKGAVTPVKDQGNCIACWAFSVTGSIEGRLFLKTGNLISLSEQQLVDCSKNNGGCSGGDATVAYEYLKNTDGIESEEEYPYRGQAGNCSTHSGAEVTKISGYVTLPSGDEAALQETVAAGPVSVSVDSRPYDFMFYYKGVFYSDECSSTVHNHAMLVVGYGQENGKEFWLVKNSLGINWGDFGYIKMARNRDNNCAIATVPSYPTIP